MTPIGHFATSMTTGTVAWKLTGSPVVGGIVAVLTHIPADLLFNEFYEWGSQRAGAWLKRIQLFIMMIPAILLYYACYAELGFHQQILFGILGCLMDVDDVIAKIFGMPIFPCHPGSVYYLPALWFNNWTPKMLKLHETAIWESILALVSVFVFLIMR